jgi:hypothetical protein
MLERKHLLTPPINVERVKDEKGVKHLVKALLNHYGWFVWMPPANGYGTVGVHDFNAIKDGTFITVETKFGTRKPTPMQKSFAAQLMSNNAFSFLVTERNIDHLAWFLESFSLSTAAVLKGGEIMDEHGARMLNAISVLTDGWGAKT